MGSKHDVREAYAAPDQGDLRNHIMRLRIQYHTRVRKAVEDYVLAVHQDEVDQMMSRLANEGTL